MTEAPKTDDLDRMVRLFGPRTVSRDEPYWLRTILLTQEDRDLIKRLKDERGLA